MDWQQVIALSIVAGTAGVFVWAKLRPRKRDFGCSTKCGCSLPDQRPPGGSIVYRARKGERPQIIVKF